jgi:hypothetical protein
LTTEEQKIAEMMERCKERAGTIKPDELSEKYKSPYWDEKYRAIPNHLTRSCLFAPTARGKRKMHDGTVLASRSDVKITFSGKQLDEADRDVFLQALHEGQQGGFGVYVPINCAKFLKSIGRSTGKNDYLWLFESFTRLTFGLLAIETKKYKIGNIEKARKTGKSDLLHLIAGFEYDPEEGTYKLLLDPRILIMFRGHEFALVDWEKRMQIEKKVDMVKWLQCLISSNEKGLQKYSLDDLKSWMDYEGRLRDFKKYLEESIKELERLEIITKGKIALNSKKKEQVSWIRL